jgi:hypothetical protein
MLEEYEVTEGDRKTHKELEDVIGQLSILENFYLPAAWMDILDGLSSPIFKDPDGRRQKYRVKRICGHIHFTEGDVRAPNLNEEDLSAIAGPLSACSVCLVRPSLVVAWEAIGEPYIDHEGAGP